MICQGMRAITAGAIGIGVLTALVLVDPAAAGPLARGVTIEPVDLTGVWRFETQTFKQRPCSLSGTLRVQPSDHPLRHTGALIASERCEKTDLVIVAEQTSILQQINLAVRIKSELDSVTPRIPYNADNFRLRIVDADTLVGRLDDSQVRIKVEFFRIAEDPDAKLDAE